MSADPLIYDVVDVTWPAARVVPLGSFRIRDGQGGGSRVSAATLHGPLNSDELRDAENAMRELSQVPKFMIRDAQDDLDQSLAALGYDILDPVNIWQCDISVLTDLKIPHVTAWAVWEPLEICREIWGQAGIGASRQAIMERADCAKTAILGRNREKPAGTAYCGIHDGVAMVHALEILPEHRRQGMGAWLMRKAAHWAAEKGATQMAVLCTVENKAANGLYAALGMTCVGHYHYRVKND